MNRIWVCGFAVLLRGDLKKPRDRPWRVRRKHLEGLSGSSNHGEWHLPFAEATLGGYRSTPKDE